MKQAFIITVFLCALLSCLDIVWTWQGTDLSSEGASPSFTDIGISHGAFVILGGDLRYSSHGPGLSTSLHFPQISPLFAHGGWWGIGGVQVSVLAGLPALIAFFLGLRDIFRR